MNFCRGLLRSQHTFFRQPPNPNYRTCSSTIMDANELKQAYQKLARITSSMNTKQVTPPPNVKGHQDGNVFRILLDKPEKKNALNKEMYDQIRENLEAAARSTAKVTVLTGSGDFYCSGNDLQNYSEGVDFDNLEQSSINSYERLRKFVEAFINHPKLLVAAVNGPAFGIAVTTLGLCDIVLASDNAIFICPFGRLGLRPEGCSSFVFPQLMGTQKALEVLTLNRQLTAQEAYERNLVTKVIPKANFHKEAHELVQYYASLPPMTLEQSKRMVRKHFLAKLHETNREECAELAKLWNSREMLDAVFDFFSKKNKSKL